MSHEILATSLTPALIIYLLDISASMTQKLGSKRRIDIVSDALETVLQQMIFRCTKGQRVSPRYRIAMYAYSDEVFDLLGEVKTIDQVANFGVPELSPMRSTDTARGFASIEKLLQRELPGLSNCPAPLVCHMTDGEFTGADPEPAVQRIMQMRNADGNVLVENIFISENILPAAIQSVNRWPGVLPTTQFNTEYARKLRAISSPLPESYRVLMRESGYIMGDNALMMLPGMNPELVEMGFVMSMSTPVSSSN